MDKLQALHELQQVQAALRDVRAKRDPQGNFADSADKATLENNNKRFFELKQLIADFEVQEEQDRQALQIQLANEERQRTNQNTSHTGGNGDLNYETVFNRWLTDTPGQSRLSADERRLLETRGVESRGTSTQIGSTDSLGGYTIPQSFSNQLEVTMKYYGNILNVITILDDTIGGTLKWPSLDDTASTGAVIGQGTATTVGDLTLGNILFGDYTIDSKIVKMSNELMNDNRVGLVQQILGNVLPRRLGTAVNTYLTSGTGLSQPIGLTRTGLSSAFTSAGATALTQAELLKLQYSVDRAYREMPGAGYMVHDTILGYIRTLELGNTNTVPIFSPGIAVGEPDRLFGRPVYINNDLDAANASTLLPVTAKKHVWFGDFTSFVMRRIGGINLSRNEQLYWAERSVGFMGWLRFDSNLINANAIKYITQA